MTVKQQVRRAAGYALAAGALTIGATVLMTVVAGAFYLNHMRFCY